MSETVSATHTTPGGEPGAAVTAAVTSADGTRITYTRRGSGVPVVLVDGALNQRAFGPNARLADVLAAEFSVFTYDRRGRGDSGDTPPYALEREIEDLHAVIQAAGGRAHVYGISSGGVLALEAADRLPAVQRLALYELPFITDDTRPPLPGGFAARLAELAGSGQRSAAVRYFFTAGVGLPAILVSVMRLMPAWARLKGLSHTLPYDAQLIAQAGTGRPLPAGRWPHLTAPILVLAGSKSPAWIRNSMRSLAGVLPGASYVTLQGQTHVVKPAALRPVLTEFFQA